MTYTLLDLAIKRDSKAYFSATVNVMSIATFSISEGRWKVWITTNELSTAGTTAQVTLTVYGHKGSSSLLPLGFGDGQHFQSGHIDEFDVS